MRYIKVLIAIVFFYFTMLFFVQNQDALSQTMPLKLDLMFIPSIESTPLSYYTLALMSFLLGGLTALMMLVWDRITISTALGSSRRRVKNLEKELQKSGETLDAVQKELETTLKRAEEAEKNRFIPVQQTGSTLFGNA